MSTDLSNDWVEWRGGNCPVPPDTVVQVRYRSGVQLVSARAAIAHYWLHRGGPSDIIAYRITKPAQPTPAEPSGGKYRRQIVGALPDGTMDIETVLLTFGITCPVRHRAIRRLLCAGLRGKGDELQDLREARDAVDRAIQIVEGGK